jgi:hypothetical protein
VAAKTRASLMVEGELPEEGLAALDGDGGDVHLALARRLAEPAEDGRDQAHSLEALFADARRGEDEAEDLLVEGGWNAAAEPLPEPIPFTRLSAAVEPERLDELPLFATASAPVEPAGAAPTSTIVTLEALTRLVGRRRSRSRPVPDGQLALFGASAT